MPGKHDPTKRFISFSIKRELFYKLTKLAADTGVDRTTLVTHLFEVRTKSVVLPQEMKDKIKEETESVRKERKMSWTKG